MYAPLHYFTLSQGIATYCAGEPFTVACRFMALDFVGYVRHLALAGNAHMGFCELLARLVVAGPAAGMAAYYEQKEASIVAQVQGKEKAM